MTKWLWIDQKIQKIQIDHSRFYANNISSHLSFKRRTGWFKNSKNIFSKDTL